MNSIDEDDDRLGVAAPPGSLQRNVLANVPKSQTDTVAAAICAIFSQTNAELVRKQVDIGADTRDAQFPTVARPLRECEGGDHDVRGLPDASLGQDVVYKSDRAVKS